jgi:hypothetical protein
MHNLVTVLEIVMDLHVLQLLQQLVVFHGRIGVQIWLQNTLKFITIGRTPSQYSTSTSSAMLEPLHGKEALRTNDSVQQRDGEPAES